MMYDDCFVDLLCEMIRMRPVSRDIEAVNRVQRRVQEFLTEKGLYCTMEKDGEREVLFAATTPGKVQDLLLCAHLDVVPAEVESQYEPYISEGILYGRGSSDCMGNAIACMKAMCREDPRYDENVRSVRDRYPQRTHTYLSYTPLSERRS